MIDLRFLLPFDYYLRPFIRNRMMRSWSRRNGWIFKAWPSMRLVGTFAGIAGRHRDVVFDDSGFVNETTCKIAGTELHVLTMAAIRIGVRSRLIVSTWTVCAVQDPGLHLPNVQIDAGTMRDVCASLSKHSRKPADEFHRILQTSPPHGSPAAPQAVDRYDRNFPAITLLGDKLALKVAGWPWESGVKKLVQTTWQVFQAVRTM